MRGWNDCRIKWKSHKYAWYVTFSSTVATTSTGRKQTNSAYAL